MSTTSLGVNKVTVLIGLVGSLPFLSVDDAEDADDEEDDELEERADAAGDIDRLSLSLSSSASFSLPPSSLFFLMLTSSFSSVLLIGPSSFVCFDSWMSSARGGVATSAVFIGESFGASPSLSLA